MEKLKAIRSGHRSAVTRLIKRTNDKISENDFKNQELSVVIETVVKKRDLIENFDTQVLDGTEAADMEQEILDSEEFNFQLEMAIHKFKDIISNPEASVPKPTDVATCIQSPSILSQKGHIVDSDFEENQNEPLPAQTAEREIDIIDQTEAITHQKNERDGGTGNTESSEVQIKGKSMDDRKDLQNESTTNDMIEQNTVDNQNKPLPGQNAEREIDISDQTEVMPHKETGQGGVTGKTGSCQELIKGTSMDDRNVFIHESTTNDMIEENTIENPEEHPPCQTVETEVNFPEQAAVMPKKKTERDGGRGNTESSEEEIKETSMDDRKDLQHESTTNDMIAENIIENQNEPLPRQTAEREIDVSDQTEVMPHKKTGQNGDTGNTESCQVQIKGTSMDDRKDLQHESTTNDMIEENTVENPEEPPSCQTVETKNSEQTEVMPHKKTDRDGGTGNTEFSEELKKGTSINKGMNQKVESTTNDMIEGNTIEKTEKKIEDLRKAERPRSKSMLEDSCSRMLNFLHQIGLERFYPNKLMLMDAMSIRATTTCFELKDVALKFVENIVMMNCTCRDQMLHEFLESTKNENSEEGDDKNMSEVFCFDTILDESESEDETEINPLDLLLALFKCSSPMLKQIIANKLFMCKLAIPFILPNFGNEPLEMCLWPLRSIILERQLQKNTLQDMSVDCPCEIVSFVRIGCPSVSKSKLLNEILTDQYHNTYLNRDCPLGTAKRILSDGMVEAAWYIPSKKSTLLRSMTMFLNLRGNATCHMEQLCGVSQLTDILVVIVLLSDLEDKTFNDVLFGMFKSKKGVVVAIDAFQIDKKVVKQKLQTFTKAIENYQRLVNVCILSVGEQMKSISIIKTEMRKAITEMMKQDIGQSVYDRLPKCLIVTDEETIFYKAAKSNAVKVFKQIPNRCLNVKETMVPLQGLTWASWSQKLKKGYQLESLREQNEIRKEMNEERQKQVQICKNMGPFMKTFLEILSNLIQSNEDCMVFVLWLKQFLDQRSRSVLPGYLSQYQTDWQALKTNRDNKSEADVINKCREALEKAEYKLAEASFGFEHLCREMGQIYESIDQCNSPDVIHLKYLANKLPVITAKLLAMGQPFEIMDGDVANVPLCWVKAVLRQLRTILGEKKLLALSVLGIQSSGKSTLLNTMFGLQFAVSAGRCTRGVFIQLVPVDTVNAKFDYVLVIDTKGLRAPELASQKRSHDNELATFVIGLGDITIVNIKGEISTEMKDVLQIAVHALLRLKSANKNLNLKQTCVFVHQNVQASDANDKMMQGRQKFVEVLDEITRTAADQENLAEIQSFNQVIDFDSEKNVWYFSDLWHGDPPMAPANPGYSESVSKLKDAIIFRLTKGKVTYLSITDTISRIEDLLNGILKDDFFFSFRNSLELKAYNSMDKKCQAIAWKLEKYVFEFITSTKSKLVSCVNDEALEIEVPAIMIQLTKEVDKQVEDLNHELDQFVAKSTLQDFLIKWTQSKRNILCIHAKSIIMTARTALNNTKHEMEINNLAKKLALQLKDQVPCDNVIKDKFNSLWSTWIQKFTTKDIIDIVPIKDQIESLVCELFPSDAIFIDKELCLLNAQEYQNMKLLEGTLTTDHISSKKYLSIHLKSRCLFLLQASPSTCKSQAIAFTNTIFRKIDLKLEELNTDSFRFHISYVSEILYIVSQEYSDFNQHTNNEYKFNLLSPFRTMIINHVVQYAIVFFTRMHDSCKKSKSTKAQMQEYKGTAWALFKKQLKMQQKI